MILFGITAMIRNQDRAKEMERRGRSSDFAFPIGLSFYGGKS